MHAACWQVVQSQLESLGRGDVFRAAENSQAFFKLMRLLATRVVEFGGTPPSSPGMCAPHGGMERLLRVEPELREGAIIHTTLLRCLYLAMSHIGTCTTSFKGNTDSLRTSDLHRACFASSEDCVD